MPVAKIAITLDRETLRRLDQLVAQRRVPNRSRVIQIAVEEHLDRLERGRLARECAKLDPADERALAEEGLGVELETWPEY
ncbi:MAG: ribbon-helix-helix protein, CopG family [Deltaproteobacteria bacterium]|nr:ribbon-helix-helix protein, CopG family [Deltaproteobacteria bacterium]